MSRLGRGSRLRPGLRVPPKCAGPQVVMCRVGAGFLGTGKWCPPAQDHSAQTEVHWGPRQGLSPRMGTCSLPAVLAVIVSEPGGATGGPRDPRRQPGFLLLRGTCPRVRRAAGGTWVAA